ncbi:hypothetical protein OM076_40395 [Solirubrobacter ginsenosidimutans]|uniref:Uncharacterized protein n=1 Tax=Solirubrobacter ginsenosidimutans TaxID=490573 RepID=A0A9X3N3U0_9ACTN|nr:hypothetical protein [Solirubrobacter ginsenosidimutans]MDA0166593.1 hypothetical protein [Solirubrobacter ginsenosidimutans]
MEAPPVRPIVAVRPGSAFEARPRLFGALAQAFPVAFVPDTLEGPHADGLIVFADDPSEVPVNPDRPTLVLGTGVACDAVEPVSFSSSPAVDQRLRGITLSDRLVGAGIPARVGETMIAVGASGNAWVRSGSDLAVHRVRSTLPELSETEVLYSLLSSRAIAAIALVEFLRGVSASCGWTPPAMRAAFLFDDPNLRWRRYGFIDYRALLTHARTHRYHASMAMIPLDAGRPHRATARLFAQNPNHLSLVFHGNDHVKRELLGAVEADAALRTAAQSIRRVARFERRSGLAVDRVMMPPHGMCSEPMSEALAAVGFDALGAIHPLPWTEEPPTDPPLAGWRAAEFVGGCPVIPRVPLTSSPADLALRAYLDHPLVIYGHHEDVADGFDVLAETAARVNRLGDVEWMSIGAIATSNFTVRIDGDHATLRPYARRIRFAPTEEVRRLTIEAPSDVARPDGCTGWTDPSGASHAFGAPVEVPARAVTEIRLTGSADIDPFSVASPPWRPWPKLRRIATEMRDRALPLQSQVTN